MRSWVQVPPGPPAILIGEMIYPVDVRVGVRVALVQIGRQGLSEKLPYYSRMILIDKTGLLQNLLELLNIDRKRESMQSHGIRSDKRYGKRITPVN